MWNSLTCIAVGLLLTGFGALAAAQDNLVANPGFEAVGDGGFFADWGRGEFGKVGKTVFMETTGAHAGRNCLRMVGTLNSFTTCRAKTIAVKPEANYWVTWWFRAKQPDTSRTYLFLQTNLAQRVFPHTDRRGDFDWTLNIVTYRTKPGETTLAPVLTMHTPAGEVGASWWDEVGVWEKLPPELEERYRREHPWDDVSIPTAQRFSQSDSCVVWGDRAEARIYPQTPAPDGRGAEGQRGRGEGAIALAAPGRGHDVFQLVVTPTKEMPTVSLQFSGDVPAGSLSHRVARCVTVKEVRDKSFPLGPTPDPLVEPTQAEPVAPGQSGIFWLEWSPPAGSKPGVYSAQATVLSGGKAVATVPLKLKRWAFDLPEVPHYRSMVMVTPSFIRRFYPGLSEDDAYRLGWDILSRHRLSGFNITLWPTPKLADGKLDASLRVESLRLELDWTRFDRLLAAAKEYRATALTLGPMLGGGASQGWKPHKFAGLTPLADEPFNAHYVEMNRLMAARLRQAGMLDKAYVYPYDEPEPDYMDKIVGLCDLIHQGAPDLKCLMTTDPTTGKPLWGKVNAWIIPCSTLRADMVEQRRAAGDEIWIYNMTAAIEETPLEHRLYLWRAARVDAAGGLLWNATWWNKINPWENPTSAAYAVGRQGERLYHYQAGQASLFYPNPDGKGPLIPALRLLLIRQGVEDFDLLAELLGAWKAALPQLAAKSPDVIAQARAAFVAPVMLGYTILTTCAARAEAVRHILAAELEVARQRPFVIAYPTRSKGQLAVAGVAETGAQLTLNGQPVSVGPDGRFVAVVTGEQLAAGLRWTATKGADRKSWDWTGLR